ncbi:MAG: cytidylyltransferase domain-containing protein [Acidimicrobiales bacterium]
MSTLLVVQAGHDGTDSHQRQLSPFADSTVLEVALRRLRGFSDGPVVVAISDLSADDALEEMARAQGAAVVRGPSDDLLARFVEVIADYPAEHLVRVRVESPLIDHHLVSQVVAAHQSSGADYTSNTLLRTHPLGLDVEVIRSDALLDAAEQASGPGERGGVTTFVHRRPTNYTLQAAVASGDYEDHDWQVRGPESLEHLTELLAKSGGDLDRSWDSFLAYDKPQPKDEHVRLRVARDNVLAAYSELPTTVGYPPDPLPLYAADRRSYGVWANNQLIGAVVVSVQNGWGTLAGRFAEGLPAAIAEKSLSAIDTQLMSDDQVIALTIDGSRIRTYHE